MKHVNLEHNLSAIFVYQTADRSFQTIVIFLITCEECIFMSILLNFRKMCLQKFSNTNSARKHRKCVRMKLKESIHPVQVKWYCYFCRKGFYRLSHLSSHLFRSHTFEKSFRCNLCFAQFYKSADVYYL